MSKGDETKQKILEVGLRLWKEDPTKVSTRNIAKELGMTGGAIGYHFPGILKEAIAAYAINIEDIQVIADLIVSNHPLIEEMPYQDKAKYMMAHLQTQQQ